MYWLRVFENRVLRRILGSKKDEITEVWRRLHNGELYDRYCSQNIIWVIKSRRVRWAGHVACMEERRYAFRVLVGRPEGKRLLDRPRHRGRIVLKWIFKKWDGGVWTGSVWFLIGTGGGLL
jgi:hypothetical protein